MAQQTAVEWLLENIHIIPKFELSIEDILEQAKQIEKDQLFEFWNGGINSTDEGGKSFDQFYETYNK